MVHYSGLPDELQSYKNKKSAVLEGDFTQSGNPKVVLINGLLVTGVFTVN